MVLESTCLRNSKFGLSLVLLRRSLTIDSSRFRVAIVSAVSPSWFAMLTPVPICLRRSLRRLLLPGFQRSSMASETDPRRIRSGSNGVRSSATPSTPTAATGRRGPTTSNRRGPAAAGRWNSSASGTFRTSGVSEVEMEGGVLRGLVSGSFQPFLEAILGHEVISLTSTSASGDPDHAGK